MLTNCCVVPPVIDLFLFLLWKAGAKLDALNKSGFTPSELALSLGNQGLARYLNMCRKIPIRARDVPFKRVRDSCCMIYFVVHATGGCPLVFDDVHGLLSLFAESSHTAPPFCVRLHTSSTAIIVMFC